MFDHDRSDHDTKKHHLQLKPSDTGDNDNEDGTDGHDHNTNNCNTALNISKYHMHEICA